MDREQRVPPWMTGTLPVRWVGITVTVWPSTGEAMVTITSYDQDGQEPIGRTYQALPLGPIGWIEGLSDAIDLFTDEAAHILGYGE